jgi:hypothetical protein
MSATESQELVSDDAEQSTDNLKLVPVAESIRYRKRAQSAEKQLEVLSEQLTQAKSHAQTLSQQLEQTRLEQDLMRKLAAAGAVDLETAVLIAKARIEADSSVELDGTIEQLKKEKQYLFAKASDAIAAKKTAGPRQRIQNSQTVLEEAARKAATSGSRADLQEYLKLRRNFL